MNDFEERLQLGLRELTDEPPAVERMAERAAALSRRMRTRRRVLVSSGVAVVAAGIYTVASSGLSTSPDSVRPGRPAPSASVPAPSGKGDPRDVDPPRERTGPAKPTLGVAYDFDLYVHCGIGYARFADRWWQAVGAQPNVGSNENHIAGKMVLVSQDSARFTAADSALTVSFTPLNAEPPGCA